MIDFKEVITIIFMGVMIILAITLNTLWYKIKIILEANGYKVNNFLHGDDLPNFIELVEKEENQQLKTRYRKMLWAVGIRFMLFIIGVIIMMIDFRKI